MRFLEAFDPSRLPLAAVEIPVFPALIFLFGAGVFFLFTVQAFRGGPRRVRRPRPSPAVVQAARVPAPVVAVPAPPIQYRKAPVSLHFPAIKAEFPDVWGVAESIDIVVRLDDKALAAQRQVAGLKITVDGDAVSPLFTRGLATIRKAFPTAGERAIIADLAVQGETVPRRSQRTLRIVEYRTEIADVFTSFREEASRAITPIREDATPWEIFDILTSANTRLPSSVLREIVSSFEEAKYSNHPVTRATYERMINALLQLERVEL